MKTTIVLALALAACGRAGAPAAPDAGSPAAPDGAARGDAAPTDATPADAAPADAAPADAAPADAPGLVIPPADLGTLELSGTCAYTDKGWRLDQADACVPSDSSGSGPATREITIAATTGGYAATTTLRVDSLTGKPYDSYTVELGTATPAATYGDSASCDPIYGTCVTHTWTLAPTSLTLTTHSLHDNYSATALPQCWEYSYALVDCTFVLSW